MEKKLFTFDEVKQKLVNYCVYQDRSHIEIEQKMKEYMLIPEAKEEILLYLLKNNYLNEERFARSYTRGKFYIKKWGRNKIKQNLVAKKIGERLIQKSFEEIDEDDYKKAVTSMIDRLIDTYKGFKEYQKQQKLIKFLISKGYEYDLIIECLDENKYNK